MSGDRWLLTYSTLMPGGRFHGQLRDMVQETRRVTIFGIDLLDADMYPVGMVRPGARCPGWALLPRDGREDEWWRTVDDIEGVDTGLFRAVVLTAVDTKGNAMTGTAYVGGEEWRTQKLEKVPGNDWALKERSRV